MDVYSNWFHQSSLIPLPSPERVLKKGGYRRAWRNWNREAGNPPYQRLVLPDQRPVPPSFPFDNIADRGFEQASVGSADTCTTRCNSFWTGSPQSGVVGDNGSGTAANTGSFTYLNPSAPQGTNVAVLQGPGSFSQSVAGGAAGFYQLDLHRRPAGGNGTFQPPSRTSRCSSTGRWWGRSRPPARRTRAIPPPYSTSPPGFTRSSSWDWTVPAATIRPSSSQVVLVEVAGQPPIADQSFEQVSVGTGEYSVQRERVSWTFSGHVRHRGQQQRLHRWQPFGPGGPPGRLPPGVPARSANRSPAGPPAPTRSPSEPPSGPNYQASRQDFDVLVDGVVVGAFSPDDLIVPELHHRRVHDRRCRVAHDHVPGVGQCRRRQYGLHRSGRRLSRGGRPAAGPRPRLRAGFAGGVRRVHVHPDQHSLDLLPAERQQRLGNPYNGSGFTYLAPNAPQGFQVAFLQGNGWFSQSVAGWAAGTYQIDFSAVQRGASGGYTAIPTGLRSADRRIGGGDLHAFQVYVPDLHHRPVHRDRRVAHDHVPGAG